MFTVDKALEPLVHHLEKRYPGVRIVWAHLQNTDDGAVQNIRFRGTQADLKKHGLLSDDMLQRRREYGYTALGDDFVICEDSESQPGFTDLCVFTRARPSEHGRGGWSKARRLLG